MTTSQVVPALERRAWSSGCAIAATPAPCVTVTTAGRERLGGALADVEAANAEFFADVADEALVPRRHARRPGRRRGGVESSPPDA